MTQFKMVRGERVQMTPQEELEFEAGRVPPTQAEIAAEEEARKDLAVAALTGPDNLLIRSLAEKIFDLERAATPTLTRRQFIRSIRQIMDRLHSSGTNS